MDTDQEMSQNPPGFDGEQVPVSNHNFGENKLFNRGGDGDGDDHVNRSSFTFTPGETDLNQLPAIPPVSSGQGLPFAPVDFPSPGDVWTWRVGRRVSATGFHKDRFLILPERLKMKNAPKSFATKNTLSRYLETNFPEMDVIAFFASFSWNIPALFQPADRVDAASLFEETNKEGENVEDAKNEGSTSRYSQRKRKQVQTQTYEPVQVKPKASGRKKKEATKQKPSSSSRRSTRQKQGDMVDLEEEKENEAAATKPGNRMKKRRGSAAEKQEDAPIPHVYVSPMNGVLAVSHSPVEINPEEFDNYLNTLENLLQQQPSEAGQESSSSSLPVTASSPVKEYEWAEARMKLSSLLDKDFSSLLMSNEAAELAALATKLKKDPSLSAEEIVRLKLIEEIPTFSQVFQENKNVIVEADRFFSALELNKAKVASLKYEYSDLKDKLGNIQTEVDANSETIRQIDDQIAQLQARRTELTRWISKKEKEKVDLSYGQKMVANSIPKVVQEVQAANSKKPEWVMKKENAVKREEEILNKFASLKGFYL
ncbi:hypothetical protein Bca4012_099086 [Brassica carinata]|uniref:DUF7081 domain-containing protein n=3 Tax=Brassica TaxID=3705 RepID=A0A0D3CSK5_BRAOL|nr:PREDICTED: uncharacterized protein LOC106300797 [Brassica oleracea var. oleracea]XP_013702764.2 uncharacterized protein LOC106406616 [Brassica napus]KAH0873415.1 hypothetical protein HID58_070777 [Brassica napus]CAF2057442.1 unnamed protein product [Brassica napus]VDD61432.1 unnamed protein product [Brassica oleracea]